MAVLNHIGLEMSGESIGRIDCIDKTNTEDLRGCKGDPSLYIKGGLKALKALKATAGMGQNP